jgi:threonine synthase
MAMAVTEDVTGEETRSYVTGLRCRVCRAEYPEQPLAICDECFGPLEVEYDYEALARVLSRERIVSRPPTMWRYRELLPLAAPPRVGLETGYTPLVPAPRLGAALGLKNLYIKNDGVCHPTLSFKDRVVAVSLSKACEFGFETVGCASTGNLANSVAANAARAGLRAYIFIPETLEQAKILGTQIYGARVIAVRGTYDDVNRLCSEIVYTWNWGLVNVNLRPFYSEGSKTVGFEIAEQLGWRAPDAVVVPMAGGSLLVKIRKAFAELQRLGLIPPARVRLFGAQARGCNPIVAAVREERDEIRPVKPRTIAHSLAIGDPADGYFAARVIRESGGWAEDATDEEILAGIRLLAETEGMFTETAGGVTVAVARKLAAQGYLSPEETVVLAITGNGLKTMDALVVSPPITISPKISDVERVLRDFSEGGSSP